MGEWENEMLLQYGNARDTPAVPLGVPATLYVELTLGLGKVALTVVLPSGPQISDTANIEKNLLVRYQIQIQHEKI